MSVPVFKAKSVTNQAVLAHEQFKTDKFYQLVYDAVIDDGSKEGAAIEVYEFVMESLDVPKSGMIKNVPDKKLIHEKTVRKVQVKDGKEQIVDIPVSEPHIHSIKDYNVVTYKEVKHVFDGLDLSPINLDTFGTMRHFYVDSSLFEEEDDIAEVEVEEEVKTETKPKRKSTKTK